MAALIKKLMSTVFGNTERRVLIVGLDATGKTTILYKLKLGEVVTTIPTIGFNVETVDHKNTSITFWDVGGCDKIRPLWRHYYQNTQGIMFVVDSNDKERMVGDDHWSAANFSLFSLSKEDELQDAPVLIMANKQDLPGALPVDEMIKRMKIAENMPDRQWHVQPCCATTGDGLYEGIDWLIAAMDNPKKGGSPSKPAATSSDNPASSKDDEKEEEEEEKPLLLRWLEQEDEDDDEFLKKLTEYTLESWDHRTHLRIAWLYLTKYGRRDGMKKIFSGIANFIQHSGRTHKTKFHETMTYFWSHMVHYAIVSTDNPTNDFKGFLFMNPQLANGGMFLEYYSKKLMLQTAEARTSVVLPDIKPLPCLIGKATAVTNKAVKNKSMDAALLLPQAKVDTDAEFIRSFENLSLSKWSHECLLRVIWSYLTRLGRKAAVQVIFARLRERQKSGFHLTITYFWIQMVDFALAVDGTRKLIKPASSATDMEEKDFAGQVDVGTFSEFLARHSNLEDSLLHKEHYSRKLIDNPASAEAFQLPDLKPLPSRVGANTKK